MKMELFRLYKIPLLTLALLVCLTGLSTCQLTATITEAKQDDATIKTTPTEFPDGDFVSTAAVVAKKTPPSVGKETNSADSNTPSAENENENSTAVAKEKPARPTSQPSPADANEPASPKPAAAAVDTDSPAPNTPSPDKEDENDIFEVDFSTFVQINEAYDRIFTPDLITEDGRVKYSTLKRKRLDVIDAKRNLKKLSQAVRMSLTKEQRIAFWINTYNFCTIELILRKYPIQPKWYMIIYPDNSIMQIPNAWTKEIHEIMWEEYYLKEIEQDFLLKRHKDPRICFALSNASVGGATLRNEPYKADRLDAQLDDQVEKYLATPKGVRLDKDNNILYLSNVFQMNTKTFLDSDLAKIKKFRNRKDQERVWLNFILPHLSKEDIRYLEETEFKIKFIEFDWHLNESK
ncbi:MAG: DUF547 domain-containing protein [Planctomycetota bacterium]